MRLALTDFVIFWHFVGKSATSVRQKVFVMAFTLLSDARPLTGCGRELCGRKDHLWKPWNTSGWLLLYAWRGVSGPSSMCCPHQGKPWGPTAAGTPKGMTQVPISTWGYVFSTGSCGWPSPCTQLGPQEPYTEPVLSVLKLSPPRHLSPREAEGQEGLLQVGRPSSISLPKAVLLQK